MRNTDEKIIRRSVNLKSRRRIPFRWLARLARHLDRGGAIPLFANRADNVAVEGIISQWRLQKTARSNRGPQVKDWS